MSENENKPSFEIDELDDQALEDAAGGGVALNGSCPTTTNPGCNMVAGCGGTTTPGTTTTVTAPK